MKFVIHYILLVAVLVLIIKCKPKIEIDYLRINFETDSENYTNYARYLIYHQYELDSSECEYLNQSLKELNNNLCFPELKDSLSHYLAKGLSQNFSFIGKKGIAFFIESKSSRLKDYELRYYYVFTDSLTVNSIYKDCYGLFRLDSS